MMSQVSTVNKRSNKKCRGAQHHYSVHSPKHDIEFCKKCDAYVEVLDIQTKTELKKGMCRCCGSKTIKHQKKTWLTRVLKAGLRQHHNVIRDWCMYPIGCQVEEIKPRSFTDYSGKRITVREVFSKKPKHSQYVEIKYNETVYEIQLKYLALYLEPINEEEKLTLIGKKLSIKGYRITYPEEEEMDERCVTCNCKLKYNLSGQIFCPECNGNQS
jgi:hypothetical protein